MSRIVRTGEFLSGRCGSFLFLLFGGGAGGVRGARKGGGLVFFLKIPGGGGVSQEKEWVAEGLGGHLRAIGAGGGHILES